MNIAVRTPARCNLVQASANPPMMGRGTITRVSGDEMEIEVDSDAPPFTIDQHMIVEFGPDAGLPRAIGVPTRRENRTLTLRVRRVPPADKREYPRIEGAVNFTYHVSPQGDAGVTTWTIGGPASAKEHNPDPFMNFSATGLLFEDLPTCNEGDTLLFSLRVPRDERIWRGSARVVRVQAIPIDERDETIAATHRIAVHFTHLAEEALEALRQHTLRIQEAYL